MERLIKLLGRLIDNGGTAYLDGFMQRATARAVLDKIAIGPVDEATANAMADRLEAVCGGEMFRPRGLR